MSKLTFGYRPRSGFTIVELFVMIFVVALVAVFSVPRLAQMAEQQRVAQAVARFGAIQRAEAMHYSLHGAYTTSVAALAVEVPEVDDGIAEADDGQWVYTMTVAGGIHPSYAVTATRMEGKGTPGSIVWDLGAGSWSGTHPLRPRYAVYRSTLQLETKGGCHHVSIAQEKGITGLHVVGVDDRHYHSRYSGIGGDPAIYQVRSSKPDRGGESEYQRASGR